ncbi:MAG: ABC transporter ATP-binding protein [Proteobacteria bacterium]|nr:ABC transporter ATP-binding protein [Pseudomonadota bacterium]
MNNAGGSPILQVKNLEKTFWSNQKKTEVLKRIDLDVLRGEALGIVGPSGVGKSTLLHILGTLDKPTAGTVCYNGEDLFSWDDDRMAHFRNRKLGFIFQFHHLLPEFSALENTMMPALIAGMDRHAAEQSARDMLSRLGLGDRLTHKRGELSGGEQQRVAVARALIMRPDIVLADEPTGNLDTHTGEDVFNLIIELNAELGITFIIVTHNDALSRKLQRCITLLDGQIVEKQ